MAFFGWIFFTKIYAAIISPEQAGEYIIIALSGLQSPAAMVTVVGVLVEVPVMLSLVALANRWKY